MPRSHASLAPSLIALGLVVTGCQDGRRHTVTAESAPPPTIRRFGLDPRSDKVRGDVPVDRGDATGDAPVSLSVVGASTSNAHTRGAFGPAFGWPIIPVHAALLPDGRVMSFGTDERGQQGGQLRYALWDPALGTGAAAHRLLAHATGTDIFCAAQALVASTGELLLTGGDVTVNGERNHAGSFVNSFSPATNALVPSAAGPMRFRRWYPTLLTLPDGRLVVLGGLEEVLPERAAAVPEVYTPGSGWTTLPGVTDPVPFGDRNWWYPRAFVDPRGTVTVLTYDGELHEFDPNGAGATRALPGTIPAGHWTLPAVMFAPGRILALRAGRSVVEVDVNAATPVVRMRGQTARVRYNASAAVLADGRVAVTGGSELENELVGVSRAVELWDPATARWSTGAAGSRARLYHSISLLLPSGALLVGGGGAPGPVTNLNAELYFPSYLYRRDGSGLFATRPVITAAPAAATWGQPFTLGVDSATTVSRVTMVRLGSVTHSWDGDQRFFQLAHAQPGGAGHPVTVTAPANANLAPPGYYMVFAWNASGVPSVARIVAIGANTAVLHRH